MPNPVGRPPMFKNSEEMQKVIDEYFVWCDNRIVQGYDNKTNEQFAYISPAPYTMTGLARRLGFSRESLSRYNEKDKFSDTIKEARIRVEEDIEVRMNDKNTFTAGLIFNAKNNFGWKDESKIENTVRIAKPLLENMDVIPNNNSIKEIKDIN